MRGGRVNWAVDEGVASEKTRGSSPAMVVPGVPLCRDDRLLPVEQLTPVAHARCERDIGRTACVLAASEHELGKQYTPERRLIDRVKPYPFQNGYERRVKVPHGLGVCDASGDRVVQLLVVVQAALRASEACGSGGSSVEDPVAAEWRPLEVGGHGEVVGDEPVELCRGGHVALDEVDLALVACRHVAECDAAVYVLADELAGALVALVGGEDCVLAGGRPACGGRHRTGAIAVAAILPGLRIAATRARDERVVIFGSGTAGIGIADQIRALMVRDGPSEHEATRRFWCVDKQGPARRRHEGPARLPAALRTPVRGGLRLGVGGHDRSV
jgi:hypothetical protein